MIRAFGWLSAFRSRQHNHAARFDKTWISRYNVSAWAGIAPSSHAGLCVCRRLISGICCDCLSGDRIAPGCALQSHLSNLSLSHRHPRYSDRDLSDVQRMMRVTVDLAADCAVEARVGLSSLRGGPHAACRPLYRRQPESLSSQVSRFPKGQEAGK